MTETPMHPVAVKHLPSFITAPGQTDILFNVVLVFLVVIVFAAGTFYLRLHALPEQIAHQTQKVQLQIVGVLALVSLFTHNQLFWIAALVLAMIEIPDFLSPVTSMARSLKMMSRRRRVSFAPAPAPVVVPEGDKELARADHVMAEPVRQDDTGELASSTEADTSGKA